MGFDLSAIETRAHAEKGKFFTIRHPVTDEPLLDENKKPIQIMIGGADASRIKNSVEERQRKRREAIAATKPGETAPDFTSWAVREQDQVDDLVLLTEGWTDNMTLDGKPFPFSKENAAVLYKRFPEIAEQMTQAATTRINFMPASSKK